MANTNNLKDNVDWEAVFETPEIGFIPYIEQAHTVIELKERSLSVIRKIFHADKNSSDVEMFTSQLNQIIPDNTLDEKVPHLIEIITLILRKVKDAEIAKNKENLASPKKKKPAHNKKSRLKKSRKTAQKSFFIYKIIAIVVGCFAGLVALILIITSPDKQVDLTLELKLMEQMNKAYQGKRIRRNSFGGKLWVGTEFKRDFVAADKIPSKSCESITWVLVNKGSVMINKRMPGKMSQAIIRDLCSKNGTEAIVKWFPKVPKVAKE